MVCRQLEAVAEHTFPCNHGHRICWGHHESLRVFPSFSAYCAPLHLLMFRLWRTDMCGGERQRDLRWTMEKTSKLTRGWEKSARRRRQVWNSDRLKRMGKNETILDRLRQKATVLEQALLQCWKREPQTLGTTVLLWAMVSKTRWTDIICPAAWAPGGCNNLLLLSTGPHSREQGQESKKSHPFWPAWADSTLGCHLPFLSASFLLGWGTLMHKMAWKNIYSGRKVKHCSARKCCKHSCWATRGLKLN